MQFSIDDQSLGHTHTHSKFCAFVLTERKKNLKHANSRWMYAVFTVRMRANDIQNIAIIYEYDMNVHSLRACIEENLHIKYKAPSE
jgi:hypothetical protein